MTGRVERWAAAAGLVGIALGAAGAAFERGSPTAQATGAEVAAYFAENRAGLLIQSLLFCLSAGAFLFFLTGLRTHLHRAEGGTAPLANLAFAAGAVGIGISALIQAPQVALAAASREPVEAGLALLFGGLGYALATIAYVPLAVMLAAVAAAGWRDRALPGWLTWLSAATAVGYLVASFGLVAESGPLVPGAVVTYLVYLLYVVWLAALAIVLLARPDRTAAGAAAGERPYTRVG